jgi:hypothetical protein
MGIYGICNILLLLLFGLHEKIGFELVNQKMFEMKT